MAQRLILRLTGAACAVAFLSGCAQPGMQAADTSQMPQIANSQSLVGATPTVLNAEFGHPALLRMDGPAQVWLYHSSVCGLNLILYPDHSGVPRVAEAVPDNGDPGRCVQSLTRGLTTAALEPPASS